MWAELRGLILPSSLPLKMLEDNHQVWRFHKSIPDSTFQRKRHLLMLKDSQQCFPLIELWGGDSWENTRKGKCEAGMQSPPPPITATILCTQKCIFTAASQWIVVHSSQSFSWHQAAGNHWEINNQVPPRKASVSGEILIVCRTRMKAVSLPPQRVLAN